MDITAMAMYRSLRGKEGGGRTGEAGITILHGHGTEPVPLPEGYTFPDVEDCDPGYGTPYLDVVLIYLDTEGLIEGTTPKQDRFVGTISLSSGVDLCEYKGESNGTVSFENYDTTISFTVVNGGIVYAGGAGTSVEYTPTENTDWVMLLIDMREEE